MSFQKSALSFASLLALFVMLPASEADAAPVTLQSLQGKVALDKALKSCVSISNKQLTQPFCGHQRVMKKLSFFVMASFAKKRFAQEPVTNALCAITRCQDTKGHPVFCSLLKTKVMKRVLRKSLSRARLIVSSANEHRHPCYIPMLKRLLKRKRLPKAFKKEIRYTLRKTITLRRKMIQKHRKMIQKSIAKQ